MEYLRAIDIYRESSCFDEYVNKCSQYGIDEDYAEVIYDELTMKYTT